DLNRTITKAMLGTDVLSDLNASPATGSITMSMLEQAILDDLNRTITKAMLGTDVLSDLNASPATGSITMSMLEQSILDDLNRTITKAMLGTDVLSDLNASPATGSITMRMLESSVQTDLNKTVARPFAATLSNPYGILGTAVIDDNLTYTVANAKVLVVTSTGVSLEVGGKTIRSTANGDSSPSTFFPGGTTLSLASSGSYAWTGMLFDELAGITPIANTDSNYTVPSGKTLVITSTGSNIEIAGKVVRDTSNGDSSPPSLIPAGTTISISSTATNAWSGYLIDPSVF
ncbi:MAG: hypothetical protein VXZ32_03710, partial [Verrucomicrobiota bacterium]|nr:hypothetical protein [Verrucomicrobiota bacterium]